MTRLDHDYPGIDAQKDLEDILQAWALTQILGQSQWSQTQWLNLDIARVNHTLLMLSTCKKYGVSTDAPRANDTRLPISINPTALPRRADPVCGVCRVAGYPAYPVRPTNPAPERAPACPAEGQVGETMKVGQPLLDFPEGMGFGDAVKAAEAKGWKVLESQCFLGFLLTFEMHHKRAGIIRDRSRGGAYTLVEAIR